MRKVNSYPTPGSLRSFLRQLCEMSRSGEVEGVVVEAVGVTPPPDLTTLANAAAWPDVFEVGFTDVESGHSYRLHAETYHGSGGKLYRLDG